MSKQHRTEVIKVLRQQMEAATDPKEKVELAKQLGKLLPKPRQARRPRKPQATFPSNKGTSALVAKWADRVGHVQPEAKRIECCVILEVEERRKSQVYPPSTDRRALIAEVAEMMKEVIGLLSAEELAVLNSGSAEVA
jgi:hypothetical protein